MRFCPHLDEHGESIVPGDDVELAVIGAIAPFHDRVSAALQLLTREVFAASSEVLTGVRHTCPTSLAGLVGLGGRTIAAGALIAQAALSDRCQ
jgi:hypothetical protein